MELRSRFCKESMMVKKWLNLLRVGASRVEWKRVNEKTGSLTHGNRYSVMKYNGHERGVEDNRSLWEIPGLKYQTWWWLSQLRATSDVKLQCLMLVWTPYELGKDYCIHWDSQRTLRFCKKDEDLRLYCQTHGIISENQDWVWWEIWQNRILSI